MLDFAMPSNTVGYFMQIVQRLTVMRILILIIWMICFTVLNYAAKRLMDDLPPLSEGWQSITIHLIRSGWIYLMIVLYAVSAGFYLLSLRVMPLSTAGPLSLIIALLCTTLLALIGFHEHISAIKGIGIALALLGTILIFWKS
jgi:multidrug transporter EmrE-like cation transporter